MAKEKSNSKPPSGDYSVLKELRSQFIEDIAFRLNKERRFNSIPLYVDDEVGEDRSKDFLYWCQKRDEAQALAEATKNPHDRDKIQKKLFYPAHKKMLRACGLQECEYRYCLDYVRPPQRKYCCLGHGELERSLKSQKKSKKEKIKKIFDEP